MEQLQPQNQQLTVIAKSIEVFKGAGPILVEHQEIAARSEMIGKSILKQWDEAAAIADPTERFDAFSKADTRSEKYLVNCRDRNKERKEVRSAITQLMDSFKTMYTTEENKLDVKVGPIPSKVQNNRNQYVQDRLKEDQRVKKLAEDKAKKEREAVDLRASIRGAFGQALINYQANRKAAWLQSFNSITLANFDEKEAGLKALKTTFTQEKTAEICAVTLPNTFMHTGQEKDAILAEERGAYDFYSFYIKYGQEMADYKKELEDKLPSKKQELLEQKRAADKAEEDRQAELKRQREAEEKRQKEIAASKDKKAAEEKAEAERKAEADRLAAIDRKNKEEQDRLNKEQADREEQNRLQLEQEKQHAEQQVTSQVELGRTAGHAQSLFDQQAAVSSPTPTPSARQGFEIVVKSPAGWVEIFTFWFQRVGVALSLDEFDKKTLGSMKKYVEDVAKKAEKDGKKDQIVSKALEYVPVAKAVNVREKGGANG